MEQPKICCMCGKPFLSGKAFQLTAEEMSAIGPTSPTEIHYCDACLNVAENLQQGAQILKGQYERNLRAAGVPNARKLADEFHKKLISSATKKLQ